MNELPEAGVGMIYLPAVESLMESQLHLLDVIELEPQTLWYNKDARCDSFNFNIEQTKKLQEYPVNKLFHSVGFPVGGTLLPGVAELTLLHKHATQIKPFWISEHLSFNIIEEKGKKINTNFLLPPAQTKEGIAVAVEAINFFQSHFKLPFAFETGTNYLQKQLHEIDDGTFVAAIAEKADCHILLDLHNIMANQLNGRQSVNDFIHQLPLERICEIHIAGGFFHNNFYLDAHSGVSSNELFEMLDKLVNRLPHLKALIFEMLPEYASTVSKEAISKQLEKMHRIYDHKGKNFASVKRYIEKTIPDQLLPYSAKEWETTLGRLALEKTVPESGLSVTLQQDNGIKIINELIFNFRASMVVTALKLSTRLLRLSLGTNLFTEHLKGFFAQSNPGVFAFAVAEKYAVYLEDAALEMPYLYELVAYEMAALNTLIDSEARSVKFSYNPFPVFRSLINGQLPEAQSSNMPFVLNIEPDEQHSDNESLNYYAVYHN
ncbi:MAG: DUF692 family multinuclear iron-containing protein [Bacteroidota bacterium]